MTPKEAAETLMKALPTGVSPSQLEEYGIESTVERAQAISREVLWLNLFWICAAIDAYIPQKYRGLVTESVFHAVEAGWPHTYWPHTYMGGQTTWTVFMAEWNDRQRRYERLVQDGAGSLAISAEVALSLEEQRVVSEEQRRNVVTLLIDVVPVETYGQSLWDV